MFECSPDGFKTSLIDLAVSKPKSMPPGHALCAWMSCCGVASGMDLGASLCSEEQIHEEQHRGFFTTHSCNKPSSLFLFF